MPDVIKDGAGSGNKARVSATNRLSVNSITESEEFAANELGDAYNINTGTITLTNDTDTPVLYIKNNEDKDLIIQAIILGAKTSTGGSSTDMIEITVVRNPTGGTIISGASDVAINSNRNYGSQNSLDTLAYKGATGNTLTGGEDHILAFANDTNRTFLGINEVLPKGATFGVRLKPQSGNTSTVVYVAVICHLHPEDIF